MFHYAIHGVLLIWRTSLISSWCPRRSTSLGNFDGLGETTVLDPKAMIQIWTNKIRTTIEGPTEHKTASEYKAEPEHISPNRWPAQYVSHDINWTVDLLDGHMVV